VLALLEPPVIVSPDVKVPEGTVTVTVVELGLVRIEAVTALVPPVMVSPILSPVDAPTVAVMVPKG
jgi:hypothetical protein